MERKTIFFYFALTFLFIFGIVWASKGEEELEDSFGLQSLENALPGFPLDSLRRFARQVTDQNVTQPGFLSTIICTLRSTLATVILTPITWIINFAWSIVNWILERANSIRDWLTTC
ncbi:hypothetical protein FQR65_LT08854 [Abscondita terminalis]|nr:hypothetical protein FQR65_LT08854 [Abscondita terminalis]